MSKYTNSESELPINKLFAELRDEWLSKGTDASPRTSASLARKLDVKPQRISQWATGSDPSRGLPPWWVILTLADDLNKEVRINADEVSVVRRRRDPNSRAKVIA